MKLKSDVMNEEKFNIQGVFIYYSEKYQFFPPDTLIYFYIMDIYCLTF